ncbi:sensor histidine kinase [Streptomyces smyrnaeus]|uniref:sensor histidine kinase n=1 Tax=Streptomyces smyrnaeus TaxID=1387713 RepID=UPI0037B704CC
MPESPSHPAQNGNGEPRTVSRAAPAAPPTGTTGRNVPARRRHGRPRTQARPREGVGGVGDAAVRRRLVRLAVLPSGLVAVIGAVVVGCVLRGGAGAGQPGAPLWGVLITGTLLVCGVLGVQGVLAAAEARGTAARCAALRRSLVRGQAELRSMLWTLRHGERPVTRTPAPGDEPVGDALDLLGHQAALAQCAAESAVVEAVALAARPRGGGEERAEVFVQLAHRVQSLVHREIELIDALENKVEDPDLLKGVFDVDHLATRTRRHAENLAVLGGALAHRHWTRPVSLSEVLRSAVAEVEHYTRIQLVPPIEGLVRGHAVADVIHLLAELVENATAFSDPRSQVLVRTQRVTAGLAVEIEDRGPGMDPEVQHRLNAVLAEPEGVGVPELVRDGRIGLYVVAALARRHGIVVQLQHNIYGGVQAVAVLPGRLLGRPREDTPAVPPEPAPEPAPAPETEADADGDGDAGPGAGTDPRPRARVRGKGRGPAAPLPFGAPAAAEGDGGAETAGRPPLPTRNRAVPQVRDSRPVRGDGELPTKGVPGSAAAFRRGVSLADGVGRHRDRSGAVLKEAVRKR